MADEIRKCVCHHPSWLLNSDRPHYVYTTFCDMNEKMKKLDKQGLEQQMRTLSKSQDTNGQILKSNELHNGLMKVFYMQKPQLDNLIKFASIPVAVTEVWEGTDTAV